MSALERCSESERCWWPDGSCMVCVVRKDDAGDHPVYRIVVVSGAEDGEEPRYLQSDFVKFSKLREAREPLERVLAPEKGAFPPSYTKSRFGASLSRKELEKRTLMVEDYFASASFARCNRSIACSVIPSLISRITAAALALSA